MKFTVDGEEILDLNPIKKRVICNKQRDADV
ncbi:MAG: hypothetical protein K1000chlam2_00055 [Chlamydiae bacterium]|nr:hypothetical protein [Chlamydiota bacterium]